MEIIKRLDHINIVRALNIPAGLDPMAVGDTPCICMEFCDGGDLRQVQSNLVNMNSTGPSKKVHIKRNFTLTVARCMGVIIPGDFKVVHIKRYFALNAFVLKRFHCI